MMICPAQSRTCFSAFMAMPQPTTRLVRGGLLVVASAMLRYYDLSLCYSRIRA